MEKKENCLPDTTMLESEDMVSMVDEGGLMYPEHLARQNQGFTCVSGPEAHSHLCMFVCTASSEEGGQCTLTYMVTILFI